jgi:hypothetical protein
MANSKDELIDSLVQKTQAKKAEIEKLSKPTWLTNAAFKGENNYNVNIKVVDNVKQLVEILAYIIGKENDFNAANLILNTNEKFDFLGFPVESWVNDIKARIDMINISVKKKELNLIEQQLDSLVSKERKEELLLQQILKQLDN